MRINGIDALDWTPPPDPKAKRRKPPPKAHYTLQFEEREAAAAAGIRWADYLNLPGSPAYITEEFPDSKCHILMWYRYHHRLAHLHSG